MSKNIVPQFHVLFRPELDGGFTAFVPSLPGCISYGADLHEAKYMITEAIEAYLESMTKRKEKIVTDEQSFITLLRIPKKGTRAYA